ncbi:MAG: methyl-accepting chemotaxis protein [Gammaproteobacteria bacterium]|nr:methyl-accepting chemotaxis protein [Gammaproteobacteria bacterium]MBU2059582.1 methyl-accepting chemotaxis protein [Gammaproteobacteria bacterium]MBU2174429.1 methyl-accepting chemotaxis protein [Gammaproteobacteria bacterium]MBU2248054.1 methyl-accepting chemotaxis protein [Gammaproteobacteria bacterium]MBU2345524.1 methyl-accepting chemotaxis protein [Gammaproteobacteria bacterium]
MLNQMSVKIRLLLLVCVPLLVLVAISLISVREMGHLSDGATSIYNDRVVPLKQIKQVADAYAVASVDLLHKYRGEVITASDAVQQLQQQSQLADQVWLAYLATSLTTEEASLADKAKQQMVVFQQKLRDYQQQITDGSLLKLSGNAFNTELYSLADPLSNSLAALIDIQLREAEKFKVQAAEQYKFFMQLFVVALLLVFLCLGGLSWLIYRSIHNPLHQLQQAISVVGDKSDLRVRAEVTGTDEIAVTAAAFNQTISRVHQFFTELADAVSQLAAASEQMSQISQQVSGTAFEQEQQANLIATAVNQMSAAIQEVAGSALATSEQANAVDQKTQQGYQKVIQNVGSIEQLSGVISGASVVIEQLNGESEKITQVLAVIQTIAGQTNLLALNAAIEAARAGEAGRGFAVVADEVRTLATNTQKATESIRAMIDNLQTSAREAVHAMAQSGQYASASVTNAKEAGAVLEDIKSSVGTIVDMNVQISAATEEQTIVAEEINKNITEFSVSIGEITRSATHSADASSALAQLASRLQQQAASYRV